MQRVIYIISILLLGSSTLFGGSPLSSSGFGLPSQYADASAMGMGGVSIAVPNALSPSKINPAGLFSIVTTRFDLQYYYENNQYKDDAGEAESVYSNFDGFSFAVPLTKNLVIALGLSSVTRMDYNFSFENELGSEIYEKSIEGSGGLNRTSLSLSYRPHQMLALGFKGDFIFGKFSETWRVQYNNISFDKTISDFTTMNWGVGYTTGLMFMPNEKWVVGAVYSPATQIDNSTEALAFNASNSRILVYEEEEGTIDYPTSWGLGLTFYPKTNFIISTEYLQTDWEDIAVNQAIKSNIQSTSHYGLGLEWQPSKEQYDSFLKRFSYRIGAYYKPIYVLDAHGNEIKEQMLTLGFGIPIKNLNSRIQLAFGYGKRGSLDKNGISENLFRIHASIAGGEKWFIRTY